MDFPGLRDVVRERLCEPDADAPGQRAGTGIIQARATPVGGLEYFYYLPRSTPATRRLFVTVHGVSRNAREHVRRFAPFAEAFGVCVLAPRFPAARFPDYQRIGRAGRGDHAGDALLAMLADFAEIATVDTAALRLFGYSGGGQFVHRFAMSHPARVAAYAVGAAGWYTFPDPQLRYPRGIRRTRAQGALRFEPDAFLRVPALVLVGDRDVVQNGEMRDSDALRAQQGESRLERGRRWVDAMRAAADARGLRTNFEFDTMPRSRHLFRHCMKRGRMGERVFRFLFGDTH